MSCLNDMMHLQLETALEFTKKTIKLFAETQGYTAQRQFTNFRPLNHEKGINEITIENPERLAEDDFFRVNSYHFIYLRKESNIYFDGENYGEGYFKGSSKKRLIDIVLEAKKGLEDIMPDVIELAERNQSFRKFKMKEVITIGWENPPKSWFEIKILSGAIADGKTEYITSQGKLDNEYSQFFRLKYENGAFISVKYYPIFILYGLIDKLLETYSSYHNRECTEVLINRFYSDHEFFANIDSVPNLFDIQFYSDYFNLMAEILLESSQYFSSISQLITIMLPSRAFSLEIGDTFRDCDLVLRDSYQIPYPFYGYRELEKNRYPTIDHFQKFVENIFKHHLLNYTPKLLCYKIESNVRLAYNSRYWEPNEKVLHSSKGFTVFGNDLFFNKIIECSGIPGATYLIKFEKIY